MNELLKIDPQHNCISRHVQKISRSNLSNKQKEKQITELRLKLEKKNIIF